MKYNILNIKNKYWDVRTYQERVALKLAAGVLAPVLAYLILWLPAHTAVQKLRADVPQMHIAEESLRAHAAELELLRHRPTPATLDAVAMKAAVEDSAVRNQLRDAISTLDLQEPNALRITMATVSFEQWLRWLRALQQEQHIRVDSVSVVGLQQAGMVKISATFVNGGSQ